MDWSESLCLPDLECHDLSFNEAHVWTANLDLASDKVIKFEQLLSSEERQRADRFHFSRHKRRYIISRGLLRSLLGSYTGTDPQTIQFNYSKKGKPTLKQQKIDKPLFFNLSHSHELVLYIFARSPWVGIDVEYIRHDTGTEDLARRYFHPSENNFMGCHDEEQRKVNFYKLWTCKEAYLKATGEGIAGLEKVEILNVNHRQIRIHRVDGRRRVLKEWFLRQIEPQQGYSGALVLKGQDWNIKQGHIHFDELKQ